MAQDIILSSTLLRQLARIASEAMPNESCAFLLGSSEDCAVSEVLSMNNANGSPYSFSIEPSELLKAYDTAEKKGLHVIGIFHSHPGKPQPSATDLKYMEINPVVWLIYSSTDQEFAAYQVEDEARKIRVIIRD